MVLGSTAAAAAPVAVDDTRASSPVGEAEGLGSWAVILAIVILIGIIGVIAAESDLPESP